MADKEGTETILVVALALGALWLLSEQSQSRRMITASARTARGGDGFGLSVPGYGAFSSGRGGWNLTIDPRAFGGLGQPPIPGFPGPAGPSGGGGGLPLPGESPTQPNFTPDPYSTPDPSMPGFYGAGSVDGAMAGAGIPSTDLATSAVGVTPFDVSDGVLSGMADAPSAMTDFVPFGF